MTARTTEQWRRADAAHYLHPFTDSGALGAGARIITRAEGVYVWDSDGNKILDGMAGLWCVNVGYGRREIAEAVARQLRELPYYNSFFQCAPAISVQLAEALSEIAPPGFGRVFFAGGGSEANDTVIRLIRHYWAARGQPRRDILIARRNAYHGSTMGGASLGGMAAMHAQGGLPIPGIAHICQPHHFAEGREMDEDEFGEQCARALEEKIDALGADRVAAFVAEPVQGAGGVVVPPKTYWPAIQKICDEHDVPIVSDEVICGFGRLGEWFGAQKFNFAPRLMAVAKGMTSGYLPMGGVMVHDEVAGVIAEKGGEFAHGYTYSGHPACAAAAMANLKILREEKIIERVREDIGPYFQKQWRTLGAHRLAAQTRGAGLMAGLEIAREDGAKFDCEPNAGILCRELSVNNGLIMRAVGDAMIVSPPLVITREEVDELVGKAGKTLDDLAVKLGV